MACVDAHITGNMLFLIVWKTKCQVQKQAGIYLMCKHDIISTKIKILKYMGDLRFVYINQPSINTNKILQKRDIDVRCYMVNIYLDNIAWKLVSELLPQLILYEFPVQIIQMLPSGYHTHQETQRMWV